MRENIKINKKTLNKKATTSKKTTPSIVSCANVKKTYRLGNVAVNALNGVDLEIRKGDFATLAGPSGSGKTTLLNMIGGLDSLTEGTIAIDDKKLSSFDKEQLTTLRLHKIGFIFQSYNLIPVLSAAENIEFVLRLMGLSEKERKRRAYESLKNVGLQGMETRRPSNLSGGQQQRVAVARALVARPSIVLADEPSANLDSKTTADLVKLMERLNSEFGVTFLISTHDPRVISQSHRHIEMIDGRISSDNDQVTHEITA